MNNDLQLLQEQYKKELLNNILPFWMEHSHDRLNGGYFTCLDRKGTVYDSDKFIWLQGRQVWIFSSLYNSVEKRSEWLDMAVTGTDFLEKYGRDSNGDWYFSLTAEGKPLTAPYNIFSDCFAAMAFACMSKVTGEERYAEIAGCTFRNILRRYNDPKGKYNKSVPGTRPLKSFSLPMILCNLSLEIEHLLESRFVEETIDKCLHEVMDVFYDRSSGLIREYVSSEGSFCDSFEGRLLNPGHGIEAMWFVMDLAERKQDRVLAGKAAGITLDILKHSWDNKFGGIYYFLDIHGHPVQQLEWDQKLWWVHIETLISLIKGFYHTGNNECLEWFRKVHDYTWSHFPDHEYGEWFGYLDRRGEVLIPLKGGKWKGCFHIPRGLYQIWKTFERINNLKTD